VKITKYKNIIIMVHKKAKKKEKRRKKLGRTPFHEDDVEGHLEICQTII
jgi:hypothetical protein